MNRGWVRPGGKRLPGSVWRRATVATGAVALAAALLLLCLTPRATAVAPTNVVVIMTDDLSTGMLADALRAGLLPKIQSEIVGVGLEFTESFVTDPLCCPSRATFLTGQYTHNHGVLTNFYPRGGVASFDDSSTLATWLQGAGVVTGFVGKYLNGYGQDQSAALSDDPTYVPPGWSDWHGLLVHRVYNYQINHNGSATQYHNAPDDYQTDVLARSAVEFLRGLPGSGAAIEVPFFLWVAPLAPHSEEIPATCTLPDQPIKIIRPAPRHLGLAASVALPRPPSFNEPDLRDKPGWLQAEFPTRYDDAAISCLEENYRGRMESLIAVDDLVGAVIETLRERQALGNTVVIFTSDNGYLFGEHRFASKLVPWEESIRVPLFFRVPGQSARRIDRAIALNNDLAPTIAELLQVQPGLTADGSSLVPWLRGTPVLSWRKMFLIEGFAATKDEVQVPAYAALRTGPTALYPDRMQASWGTGAQEYYDLRLDPFQLRNPSATLSPEARQWIVLRRDALRSCAGASCRTYEGW